MSELPYTTLFEEALESWEDVRNGVIAEAEGIPPDRYDYRPHPESRTVAELILHILESGEMMVGELTHPEGDFSRQGYPQHMEEHAGHLPESADAEELQELLRSTLESGLARFREAGELHMLQFIRRFDGLKGTRLAWMEHGIAHEMYHRGQLALYARTMGLVPALTRLIRGG